jgi:uncharacterized membrane protein
MDLILARVIHVLAVVFWIGGVAMVTTVILPAVRRMTSKEEQYSTFEKIEGRFSLQAKITTLLTAASGFYMIIRFGLWERLLEVRYWWMLAMILVWLIFSVVLFILEPLVLHRMYKKGALENPEKTYRFIQKLHWFLLVLSLVTTAGAVAGSHGFLLFD